MYPDPNLYLTVQRLWRKPDYTIGKLLINGMAFCDTLEDTDRGLDKSMPLKQILEKKIYGRTAIPTGVYRLDMATISPRLATRRWAAQYGGVVPRLLDVPGFDGVLIHPGNTAEDTLGCILVGRNKAVGKVLDSTLTYQALMDGYLWPSKKSGGQVWLEIR